MRKLLALFGIILFLSACGNTDLKTSDEERAIEIVKKSRSEHDLSAMLGKESTNLEFATTTANANPNKHYSWSGKSTGTTGVYVVSFVDDEGWGHQWEVDVNQEIVKYINSNEALSRKYGLTRNDQSNEFEVINITVDTFRTGLDYFEGSKKVITYEIKGEVKNNTDKMITSVRMDGALKYIFPDATVTDEPENKTLTPPVLSKVSEDHPVKPNESFKFRIRTRGISTVYLNYSPDDLIFELSLIAEDPIGYEFDKNIYESHLKEKFEAIRPKGAERDSIQMLFIYEKDGKRVELTAEQVKTIDESYVYVDRIDRVIKRKKH